jgi:hypothetical protein
MSVYVFVGPTLSVDEASRVLDAVYLPPAARGDVYRVACLKPQAIGIIDGYFDTVPSIWHKEILWAMQQGVHVFGCSSMGALRAAELAAFGMEGIGSIFAAYRDGMLTDDDEVAVVHAPAEQGYQPFSVAMVNIRATLAAAEAQQVISPEVHTALLELAKARFYAERTYAQLLEAGHAHGVDAAALKALQEWLPTGQVDLKRADALAMLAHIRDRLAVGLPPKAVRYHFEHTIFWEHVRQSEGDAALIKTQSTERSARQALLEEARLAPVEYQRAHQGALARVLARALSEQQGQRVTEERVEEAIRAFRRAHDLLAVEDMERWLEANQLSDVQFVALMQEVALLNSAVAWAAPSITPQLVDQLRLDGVYARFAQRAQHKMEVLVQAGLDNPSFEMANTSREELLAWYFAQSGRDVPLDLNQYVQELGFIDESFFIRALLREWCYQRLTRIG